MADTWTAISGYTPQDYTDTAVFEVNSDTKKIALITGQALVAGEENSQYIKFVLDRYWDGIDIKDKAFYIEYALAGQYYGKTAAVNAEYNTEQVRFGWVVNKEACCISGTLLFVLRIESTEYVLKTQVAEHPVFKSVNVEDVVPEPTKEVWYREFEARVEVAIDDAEAALTAAQAAQTGAEIAAQNAQTAEDNAEQAAASAQIRYGSPLTAQTAEEMTEENRVYVYIGSETGYTFGHWYYHDGEQWTDGGVYNSVAVDTDMTLSVSGKAADAKATGDEINSIVNSAYVTDSASGGIAHFEDGADDVPVKSLKVAIEPVQSGSGDPSPDNDRPISGFNSVKVTRSGKNLLDTSNMSTASISGVTYSRSDDGVITVGGKATAGAYKQIAQFKTINGVQYTITGSPNGAASGKYRMTVAGYGYEYGSGYTFTGDGNTHVITLDVYAGYPDSGTLTFKPMIRAASIADDAYEPYKGDTYPITIPTSAGTVYGGTLDVVSGELVIDRRLIDLIASGYTFTLMDAAIYPNNHVYKNYSIGNLLEKNNSGDISKIICNYLPPRARAATGVGVFQVHDGNANEVRLSFPKEDRFATWASVQEWMRSLADPFVLCIPLAESLKTTYNLTPTEVKSLLGINNIWSDEGDVDVEYRADTKLYIKRLTDSDTDMIADANIVSGQYFMVGNDLYKATVNIASGAQIVVGTNATKVSLSEALNQIKEA